MHNSDHARFSAWPAIRLAISHRLPTTTHQQAEPYMHLSVLSALSIAAALLGIPSRAAARPLDGCTVTQAAGVSFYLCPNKFYDRSSVASTCLDNPSQLAYDVYVPTTFDDQTQIKFPLVVVVHGGRWQGTKIGATDEAMQFAALGHVVVNIDYRPACENGHPNSQMAADVQQFIEFIFTGNPPTGNFLSVYKIDPSKITITGASAGAHLALMAAVQGNRWFHNVVVSSSPTELDEVLSEPTVMGNDVFKPSRDLLNKFFEVPDMRSQSPLYYLASGGLHTDSLYMDHNQNDHVVPFRHTTDFVCEAQGSSIPMDFPCTAQGHSIPTFFKKYNFDCPLDDQGNDVNGHCVPPLTPDPVRGWCGDLTSGRVGFINRNGGTLSTAAAAQELPGWSACGLVDGDITTIYSSPLADRFNSPGHLLAAWFNVRRTSWQTFDDPVAVSQVILRARMGGSPRRALGFPVTYDLWLTDVANSSWVSVGTFTTQPNAAGEVVINVPARQTHGVLLIPRELGTDDFGNYYLQMADIHLQ